MKLPLENHIDKHDDGMAMVYCFIWISQDAEALQKVIAR